MPQIVLEAPLGQMLMCMLKQQVSANKCGGGSSFLGIQDTGVEASTSIRTSIKTQHQPKAHGHVHTPSTLHDLDNLLGSARNSCALVFFTSPTCGPCRELHPLFEQLAADTGDTAILIKADISRISDAARRHSISSTPTFLTFLRGEPEKRWSGADPSALRGNLSLLVQMAHLPRAREALHLHSFADADKRPITFAKVPPLDKVAAKTDPSVTSDPAFQSLRHLLRTRSQAAPAEAALSNMAGICSFVQRASQDLAPDLLFPLIDLVRCALADPRFSGFLAKEAGHPTILSVLARVNILADACPYPLHLVTLQACCNLFATPLVAPALLGHEVLREAVKRLISSSQLDKAHTKVRGAAAALLFNIALADRQAKETIPEEQQIERAAAAEALGAES